MTRRGRSLRPAAEHSRLRELARPRANTAVDRLQEVWAAAIPRAAKHSWPERVSRVGVVTIGCQDAGWAQELAANADTITRRLVSVDPSLTIRQLRFVVSARQERSDPAPARSEVTPSRPTPGDVLFAQSATLAVADPTLRERLERVVAAALALDRTRAHARGHARGADTIRRDAGEPGEGPQRPTT